MKTKSVLSPTPSFDRASLDEARRQMFSAAEGGDTFFARMLLTQAIGQMRKREPLRSDLADYIAGLLTRCMENPKRAAKILGLVERPGHPSGTVADRDFEIAWDVFYAVESGKKLNDNAKGIGAFAAVADTYGVKEDVVKRAWEKYSGDPDFGPPLPSRQKIKGTKST